MSGRLDQRTWVGNTDADVSALELGLAKFKSLLQAIDSAEFDVTETLRSAVKLVLDDANAGDFAAGKEVLDIGLSDFKGKVAQVSGVWGLVGKRELLADGIALES